MPSPVSRPVPLSGGPNPGPEYDVATAATQPLKNFPQYPQQQTDEWLDAVEAARYTSLSLSTLAKRRLTGDGAPFSKAGRKVLYRRSDLDHWLLEHRRQSTSDRRP